MSDDCDKSAQVNGDTPFAEARGWAARSNVEPIARDPQCHNCAYAWPNMTGIRGDGWCYMFRERWHSCAKKVVRPNNKVSDPRQ